MYKLLSTLFLLSLLIGCGVNSDSSNNRIGSSTSSTTGDSSSSSSLDDGSSGDSSTASSSSSGSGGDGNDDSIFDSEDAEEDPNACNPNSYRFARDASFGGSGEGENGAGLFFVNGQGLWIGSEHLEADATNRDKTWVTLFYKSFPSPSLLNQQGSTSYLMQGVFLLSYDIAWSDASIPGVDNTVYVQSANFDVENGEKPKCYRAVLNSTIGSQIEVTKVYR